MILTIHTLPAFQCVATNVGSGGASVYNDTSDIGNDRVGIRNVMTDVGNCGLGISKTAQASIR